jgi:peptidoglycan/xylan/chitin deacetylase (PgdA/CDA1 family)
VNGSALVLVYHAIEAGPAPLCMEPSLFHQHLETIDEIGARVVELDQLAVDLADGGSGDPSVAITFDDGAASVVENAAPLLLERGAPATMFCVAGHLGGRADWPSAPARMPALRLASPAAVRDLATERFRVGSHGMTHARLADARPPELRREIVDSKSVLEDAIGIPVSWFSYPYGSLPQGGGLTLVRGTYAGAAALGNRLARDGVDLWALPRVDAHYLRRPALLARVLLGDDRYLALRRAGARLRRLVYRDYVGV